MPAEDEDEPVWESWMASGEAQLFAEQAEAERRWRSSCYWAIDRLWASLTPADSARELQHWWIVHTWKVRRFKPE